MAVNLKFEAEVLFFSGKENRETVIEYQYSFKLSQPPATENNYNHIYTPQIQV